MKIREEFIQHALSGRFPVTALCNAYGISEKTGHKWLNRFKEEGRAGLADRSHVAHELPHRVSLAVRNEILSLREKHPTWGPRKIRAVLKREARSTTLPASSTIGEILRREGCVKPRRRRHRAVGLSLDSVLSSASNPNDVWTADFKGEFRLESGSYCYPLTVQDLSSRYLIGTTALSSTASIPVKVAFARHFEEFGLPKVIRTDNGIPFASPQAIGQLSRLSVWWLKLGIRPERIRPAHPQENGKHERMHKTLKAEATRPPSATLSHQQTRLDRFQREYNTERPHESLNQETPASCYLHSPRSYNELPERFAYPAHFEARYVAGNGMIHFRGKRFFLSESLTSEEVGLEEIEDQLWRVDFGPLSLGSFDEDSDTFIQEVRWKADEPPDR
ncbi:MAG TPA: IS481 family transposase [Gemmatimonadaceae bacterium]|nr:IS481 family transposase [Gemmatimonadaceae bacterium]